MNPKHSLFVLAAKVVIVLFVSPAIVAGSEPTPVIVTPSGEFSVTLTAGDVRESRAGDFFRFGAIYEPDRRNYVELVDGSRLVLAPSWGRREPMVMEAGRFKLQTMEFGEINIERGLVARVVLSASGDPLLLRSVRKGGPDADSDAAVWTSDGDLLLGSIERIGEKRLELKAAGQATSWELIQLAAVAFQKREAANFRPNLALGFEEGSLLYCDGAAQTENVLPVRLACGVEVVAAEPGVLCFAQRLAGDFWPLAQAQVINYQQTPYLGATWPLAINTALDGGPLFVAGERRLLGVTCHSAARIIYRVPPGATRLTGQLAIVDGGAPAGSVDCYVFAVRDGRLEEAYRSPTLRSGCPPRDFTAELTGAQGVALVTDYADHGDTGDQAAWLDCRFER